MKRIAIYGVCERGIKINKILKNSILEEVQVVNFIDKNENKIGECIEGVEIISVEQLYRSSYEKSIDVIIIAANEVHHMKITKQLNNIDKKKLLVPNKMHFNNFNEDKTYQLDEMFTPIKPVLKYLEFHVCDNCNLNCKGCGHFANLAPKDSFADLEQFKKDIKRLSELFQNILTIRILGGEPLLNKDLDKFIIESRKAFPEANLRIVTNGILLPEVSQDLVKTIKENRVSIDISWYKPTVRIKDRIREFLYKNNFEFDESNIYGIDEFYKHLTLSDQNDKHNSANKCLANECYFMEKGFISKCGFPFLIKYLKRNFEINEFDNESIRKSSIDIYDKKINGYDVFNFLDEPSEFCKYCSESNQSYGWKAGKPDEAKLQDWIII